MLPGILFLGDTEGLWFADGTNNGESRLRFVGASSDIRNRFLADVRHQSGICMFCILVILDDIAGCCDDKSDLTPFGLLRLRLRRNLVLRVLLMRLCLGR